MICRRNALLRLALFLFIIVCLFLYSTNGSDEEVFRDYSVDETLLEGSVEDEAAGPNQNSNVEIEELNGILSSRYHHQSSITVAPHEQRPVIIGESLDKLKDSEVEESVLDDESALDIIDEDYDQYDGYVEGEYEELPHCTEDNSNDSNTSRRRGVVVVSTLDGRISGVDALTGSIIWSHQTGRKQYQSMLSSSMSKMELTSRGDWVRLIPSLDGGIYRFDGENVEALPVTAETLLHSSFKFNEDTIFTGGKITEVLGIAADTGHLVYLCDDVGCKRQNMASRPSKVLVIRRVTQTIRAIDPKNGSERWNFSVGHHELNLAGRGCESASSFFGPTNVAGEELPALHFVVPEGVVYAVDEDSNLLWKQKMSSPVVSAWKIVDGHPMQLDLFSMDTIPALGAGNFGQEEDKEEEEVDRKDLQPALYVGIHKKQLYIQQSGVMRKKMDNIVRLLTTDQPGTDVAFPRVQWRPYLATALSRTPVVHHSHSRHPLLLDYEKKHHTTALTVKHKVDYPYDNGYYLYGDDVVVTLNDSEVWHDPESQADPQLEEESILDVANHIYHVCFHVGPELWIKLAGVFLCYAFLHVLIIRYILNRMRRHLTRQAIRMVQQMLNNILQNTPTFANIIRGLGVDPNPPPPLEMPRGSSSETVEEPSPPPIQDSERTLGFTSRYLSDFEALHCLGRGGFGVVFHVRNRLDEVEYAVKRIPLPAKESSAERVKREVRALAKLNHTNIVRYYNSWLETPPNGWLEATDAWWKKGDVVSSSVFSPGVEEEEEEEEGHEEYPGNVSMSEMEEETSGLQLNPGLYENKKVLAEQTGMEKGRTTNIKQSSPPLFPSDFHFSAGRTEWKVDLKSSADNTESHWSSEEVSRVQSESNSLDTNFQDSCSGKEDFNIMGENSDTSENSFDIVFENTSEDTSSRSNVCVNSISSGCDKVINSRHIEESTEAQSFSIVFENGEKTNSGQCLPEINKTNSSQGDENKNAVLQWRKEYGRTVSESSGIKFQKGKRRPTTLSLNEEGKGDSREEVQLRKTPVPKPRTLLYIQMELCQRESLRDWLKQNNNRQLKTYSIFNDIVKAVEYVHDNHLMHRDLKPSNIFFSLDGEVKIGDFGLVTAITEENEVRTPGDSLLKFPSGNPTLPQQQQLTKEVGTQLYMSPEQVNGLAYDFKVDIFSMGLIFFEMLVPFSTGMERLQVMQAVRERNFPEGFKEKFPDEHDLLVLMLSSNPKERPTTRGMRVRNPLRALQGDSVNDIHVDEHFRLSRSRSHTRSHSGSSFSFLSSSGSSLS